MLAFSFFCLVLKRKKWHENDERERVFQCFIKKSKLTPEAAAEPPPNPHTVPIQQGMIQRNRKKQNNNNCVPASPNKQRNKIKTNTQHTERE